MPRVGRIVVELVLDDGSPIVHECAYDALDPIPMAAHDRFLARRSGREDGESDISVNVAALVDLFDGSITGVTCDGEPVDPENVSWIVKKEVALKLYSGYTARVKERGQSSGATSSSPAASARPSPTAKTDSSASAPATDAPSSSPVESALSIGAHPI